MSADNEKRRNQFSYALNTSTLRYHNLSLPETVKITGMAGYDAIEIWIDEIEEFEQKYTSITELKKIIEDNGIKVAGLMGFSKWADNDADIRKKSYDQLKTEMEKTALLGGDRIAAPLMGDIENISLSCIAERYSEILKIGMEYDVLPCLEIWGFLNINRRLSEAAYIMIETAMPEARLLLDVYHMYKGGGGFGGLQFINGNRIGMFHINDYPGDIPQNIIDDKDRVLPGDGDAPLLDILKTLTDIGYNGALSLELFMPELAKKDALEVAENGLKRIKDICAELGSK